MPDLYCSKCGTKIAIDQKFCRSCGAPVVRPAQARANSVDQQASDFFRSKVFKVIASLFGVVIVCVCAGLCLYLYGMGALLESIATF